MVNSWSLLYDELYGDDGMSEKNETKNDNSKDSNSDTIVFGNTTIAGGEGSDILEIHGWFSFEKGGCFVLIMYII